MIDRVKNWLGIEGVKMTLDIPDIINQNDDVLYGILNFKSLKAQHIESFSFSFIETYHRGRGKEKRIDDQILAYEVKQVQLHLDEKSSYAYPFKLSFQRYESKVDQLARNPILKPIMKTMKWLHATKSIYTLNVSAEVKGNKLQPYVQRKINFA